MWGHTKKCHTDNSLVDLHVTGPQAQKEKALKVLKELGFYESSSDTIPWRESFPDIDKESRYSRALRGARTKEGLTQKELSKLTGIPQAHISYIENGKMEIGKERAKRLGEVLKIDYRLFL